ncbi:MAG: hypothetical protein NPIRA06_01670 [Nitrospirales bacterium]|nr:MAG: hypothetical protein NPIRA06_01670 [Nitrospirales bacterium]
MIAGMASALSGIQTGGRILSVGAHNIANSQTESFKRIRGFPEESSTGNEVRITLQTDKHPRSQFLSGEESISLREGSNVDLGEEIISNLQAVNLIEANIASIKIQDKVLGSLLDLTG